MAFHRVTEHELRRRFNESGLWEAAKAGYYDILREETEPDPSYNQPQGTTSVRSEIRHKTVGGDPGSLLARCHHYEAPDGTILNGAQAPDPKWFKWEGETWVLGQPPAYVPLIPKFPPPAPPPRGSA